MITFGNGHDDGGLNDDSSIISYFGNHLGHSRAYPARGKNRISKDLSADAGGGSKEATVDAQDAADDDDDDGGGDDPDPDRRRPRKTTFYSTQPALLAFAALSQYIGFGRSRIYQLISEGKFPSPIKVGKSSRWVRSEVDLWLEQQIAARPQAFSGGAL